MATTEPTLQHPSAGISRVDQESTRTHGFVVRFGYRKTAAGYRPKTTRFLGDKTYGGKAKAWAAAEKFAAAARRRAR